MKFNTAINILIVSLIMGAVFLMCVSISKTKAFSDACRANGGTIVIEPVYQRNAIRRCIVDDEVIMIYQYHTKDLRNTPK